MSTLKASSLIVYLKETLFDRAVEVKAEYVWTWFILPGGVGLLGNLLVSLCFLQY